MNVSELYDLTYWIDEEIVNTEIPEKYQQLHQILHQNSQPNNQNQPFESQKDDLLKAIKAVPLTQLTKEQLVFLRALGIAQAVGKEGTRTIEDVLYRNVLDIATSVNKIQQIHQKLKEGIKTSNQIKTGLNECIAPEEYEIDKEVMIRVTFTGNATMSNVSDFKKWGNTWHEIGRGIAMAHNAAPEDIRIIGATKGSVTIELATSPEIAITTSMIILFALELAQKILDIRKKAEEIKNLQLQNKQLAKDIKKEATKAKQAGVDQICERLMVELTIEKDGNGDKAIALDKAVKDLIDFIEFGGEVDFIVPDENDDEDNEEGEEVSRPEYEKLRNTITDIRLLEDKLKLLEPGLEESNSE